MKYKTQIEFEKEEHPWEPYIPNGATKLILGTFPTRNENRGSFEFFYPNSNNPFWNIIAKIANDYPLHKFDGNEAVEERKQI